MEQHRRELAVEAAEHQPSVEPEQQLGLPPVPEFRWLEQNVPEIQTEQIVFPSIQVYLGGKISTRGRNVLVGRLDDRLERSVRPYFLR